MADHPTHLDAATLAELRARLVQERARLRGLATPQKGDADQADTGIAPSDEPNDYGDQALELTQEDTEYALRENERILLGQVEHALERMQQGTYGLSEVTGQPIPLERLQIVPWATTNVTDREH
jgi:DnaK suppressor protein